MNIAASCPSCGAERADYEGPDAHLEKCPNCQSSGAPVFDLDALRTQAETAKANHHYAAFDPPTVLSLLSEIERLREQNDGLYAAVKGEHNRADELEAEVASLRSDKERLEAENVRLRPVNDAHGEGICHRCWRPNIVWSSPSPLWNEVMRGGDINGEELFDGIVCPVCFAQLAEAADVAMLWTVSARSVRADLKMTTPSGRVWNEQTWMWEEPDAAEARLTHLERIADAAREVEKYYDPNRKHEASFPHQTHHVPDEAMEALSLALEQQEAPDGD